MEKSIFKKIILIFSLGTIITASITTALFLFMNDKYVVKNFDSNNYKGCYRFSDGHVYNISNNGGANSSSFKKIDKDKFIDTNLNEKFKNAASADDFKDSLDNYYSKPKESKSLTQITENFLIDLYIDKSDPTATINFDDITFNTKLNTRGKYMFDQINSDKIDITNLYVKDFFEKFFDKYINTPIFKRISANTIINNTTNDEIEHINLKLISNLLALEHNEDFSSVDPEVKKILGNRLDIFKRRKDMPTKILSFKIKQKGVELYTPEQIDSMYDSKYIIKLKKPLKPGEKLNIRAKYIKQLINFGGRNISFIFRKFFNINLPKSTFLNRKSKEVYDDWSNAIPSISISYGLSKKNHVKFQYPKKYDFSIRDELFESTSEDPIIINKNPQISNKTGKDLDKAKKTSLYSFDPKLESSFISLRKNPLVKGTHNEEGSVPIQFQLTSNTNKLFKDEFIFEKTNLVMKELKKKVDIDILKYYKKINVTSVANINGGAFIYGNIALNTISAELKSTWLHEIIHSIYGGTVKSFEWSRGINFFEESITEFLTILYINKLQKRVDETKNTILKQFNDKENSIYKSAVSHIIKNINQSSNKFWDNETKPITSEWIQKPILWPFRYNFDARLKAHYEFGPLIHLEFFAIYEDKYLEVIKEISQIQKSKKRDFNVMDLLNVIGKKLGPHAQLRMSNALLRPISEFELDINAFSKFVAKYKIHK